MMSHWAASSRFALNRVPVIVVLAAIALAGCGGTMKSRPSAPLLVFQVSIDAALGASAEAPAAEAEVWIDGTYYIGALERGIRLKPGAHQIEIRHDDYHTAYFEVVLTRGQRRVLQVNLAEILP